MIHWAWIIPAIIVGMNIGSYWEHKATMKFLEKFRR